MSNSALIRRMVSIGCLAWCFLILNGCGTNHPPGTNIGPQFTVIGTEEKAIDGDNRRRERSYWIKNTGDADLQIGSLSTSCGCTSATISRNLIPPHELATLSVAGDAPQLGVRTVRIFVPTNMAAAPRRTLEWDLIGEPRPPTLLTEAPTLNAGILKNDATLNEQSFAFEVLELRAARPHVTRVVGPPIAGLISGGVRTERDAPTGNTVIRGYEYHLTAGEALKPGPLNDHFQVAHPGFRGGGLPSLTTTAGTAHRWSENRLFSAVRRAKTSGQTEFSDGRQATTLESRMSLPGLRGRLGNGPLVHDSAPRLGSKFSPSGSRIAPV